jgi:nucleoside-diphosphate-sugar epimerase
VALYLITGGAGFIGSHLATALVERGDRVRVLDDLSTGRLENLGHLDVGEPGSGAPVELLRGDVTDPAALARGCEGAVGVFHEAAQVSVPMSFKEPVRGLEINVLATARLLEEARRAGVRGLVFAASSAAYGNSETLPKTEDMTPAPLSPYAVGKLASEHMLGVWGREHGLHTVSLRYFNVFGPRQADDSPYTGVIAIFARALFEGRGPTIHGDGEQTRDFTHVSNAVRANLLAMDARIEPGQVFNVGGGERVSINQLWARMAELEGVDLAPDHIPTRSGDVRHSLAGLKRARELLGYEPVVSWQDGLADTLAWYRERFGAAR